MKIAHIDIQNFRKLKACRVDLADENTVFVGANNSGKTSAMDVLIMFLKKSKRRDLSTTDITLSNWSAINEIGNNWINTNEGQVPDCSLNTWRLLLPTIDVWLHANESQIHYVSHILPSLDWDGGLLGVRLILEPRDMENLYKSYIKAYKSSQETLSVCKTGEEEVAASTLKLWPTSMQHFLDRKLHEFFSITAYVLDPSFAKDFPPQPFTELMESLDDDPFDGLFKIDIINAQRGFSDSNTSEGKTNTDRRLTSQLRHYFDKHLDPTELPDVGDLEALETLEAARNAFDEKINLSLSAAIGELEELNYPGFSDPKIILSSKVNPLEGLNHDSAVQFKVACSEDLTGNDLCLPEKYNGLGFQNLISMIFNLIRFRDEWMRVGKVGKREESVSKPIEPLHLMLIEEPEAHLHAQVQQVFIKKAYKVLRNHPQLRDNQQFATQMVISTHSSHIAHEADFTGLRYFHRSPLTNELEIPCASVVNMTTTFGTGKKGNKDESTEDKEKIETAKFATRYLKTTHCDLFFADAVILVEGPAERLLIPHFIRYHYPVLDRSYISLLEIGGSHAHRLRPLIEVLGIPTLVITDLDSIRTESRSKIRPKRNLSLRTGNDTLKNWLPGKIALDEILAANPEDKTTNNDMVRVTYPCETIVHYDIVNTLVAQPEKAIPYTFEDALVLGNISMFKNMTGQTGLIKKMADAANKETLDDACQYMFDALNENAKKAEMALELLYTIEPSQLNPPQYIAEGLNWLTTKLSNNVSFMTKHSNASDSKS